MAISRQREARSRDYVLLLSNDTSGVLYSAQYNEQHYPYHDYEQFGALYMHNSNEKHPTRPGLKPSTSQFPATTGLNEHSRIW